MINEKDIQLSDINPILPNDYFKIVKSEIMNIAANMFNDLNDDYTNIMKEVCVKNNININDLLINIKTQNFSDFIEKYSDDINKIGVQFGVKKRNRRILPPELQCMGRKLDLKQCTRGRIDGTEYCKSHKNKLKYGRIDDELEFQPLKKRGRRRKSQNSKNNYVYTTIRNIDGIEYLVENGTNYVFTFDMNNPKFLGVNHNDTIVSLNDL